MVTCGAISTVGDITAQKIESNTVLDVRRSLVMTSIGFGFTAPSLHHWYDLINGFFAPGAVGGQWLATLPIQGKLPHTLALLFCDQVSARHGICSRDVK